MVENVCLNKLLLSIDGNTYHKTQYVVRALIYHRYFVRISYYNHRHAIAQIYNDEVVLQ